MSLNKLTTNVSNKSWMRVGCASLKTDELQVVALEADSVNTGQYKTTDIGNAYKNTVLVNDGTENLVWDKPPIWYKTYWASKLNVLPVVYAVSSTNQLVTFNTDLNLSYGLSNTDTTGIYITSDGYYDVTVELDVYATSDVHLVVGTTSASDILINTARAATYDTVSFTFTKFLLIGTDEMLYIKSTGTSTNVTVLRASMSITSKGTLYKPLL